jgi:hypothetical protein
MSDLVEIARRKERLIARCAAQRVALAGTVQDLKGPIALLDRALAAGRFVRSHPLLLAAAVAAAVALRQRAPVGLAARALAAWRLWRALAGWAQRLGIAMPRARRPAGTGHAAP